LAMTISRLESAKILVVEGDQRMRSFMRAVLSVSTDGNMEYAEASNGEEALKVLNAFKPDMIISAMGMNPVSGLDLLQTLRQGFEDISPFIPFLLISETGDAISKVKARDAGVTAFLEKPVSVTDLHQGISDAILNTRPFIRSRDYFGPNRRSRENHYSGDDRRNLLPVFVSPPIPLSEEEAGHRPAARAS